MVRACRPCAWCRSVCNVAVRVVLFLWARTFCAQRAGGVWSARVAVDRCSPSVARRAAVCRLWLWSVDQWGRSVVAACTGPHEASDCGCGLCLSGVVLLQRARTHTKRATVVVVCGPVWICGVVLWPRAHTSGRSVVCGCGLLFRPCFCATGALVC